MMNSKKPELETLNLQEDESEDDSESDSEEDVASIEERAYNEGVRIGRMSQSTREGKALCDHGIENREAREKALKANLSYKMG